MPLPMIDSLMSNFKNTDPAPALVQRGLIYVLIQAILLGLLFFAPSQFSFEKPWPVGLSYLCFTVGAILFVGGIGFAVMAAIQLGKNLTPLPHPKENAELIIAGLYRWVRHPIYFGVILLSCGWFLMTQGLITLIYLVLLILFFDLKSRKEELWLIAYFPEYSQYQRTTKKIIPGIY